MKNITYKSFSYQIPFDITCTVSGVVKTYTSEEYINGKIDRFGSLDLLRANYISRDAKKAAKEKGTTLKEVTIEKPLQAPVVFEPSKAPVPLTKEANEADVCHNPSFVINGKPCSTCAFFSICKYKDTPIGIKMIGKRLKKAA